jgi:hypothetical protein
MPNFTAYYYSALDNQINDYTVALIHRVEEEGTLRGVDAMYEKGLTVTCPEACKEGWYYDEINKIFISPEEFEKNKNSYEKPHQGITINIKPYNS